MTDRRSAVLYLRSAMTNDEAIAEQHESCCQYAEAYGWHVCDVVIDNGISGMIDAPGLTGLYDRISSGELKAIIATDLSRISRDPDRIHAFAQFCRQHGTAVYLAERHMTLDTLLDTETGQSNALGDFFAARGSRS